MMPRKSVILGPRYAESSSSQRHLLVMHLLPFHLVKSNYFSNLLSPETGTMTVVLSCFIRKLIGSYALPACMDYIFSEPVHL